MSDDDTKVIEGFRRSPSPVAKLERWIFRGSHGGTLEPVRVVREGDRWTIDDKPLTSGQVASGYLEPLPSKARPGGLRLCLFDHDHDHERVLDLVVKNEANGRHLLESLDLDPSHRAMTFIATSVPMAMVAIILFMLGISLALALPIAAAARVPLGVAVVALSAAVMRAARYPITVSADGLEVDRWQSRRFIAFAEVRDATAHGEHSLALELKSRETVSLELPAAGVVGDMSLPHGWFIRGDLLNEKYNQGGGTLPTPNHAIARHVRALLALPEANVED